MASRLSAVVRLVWMVEVRSVLGMPLAGLVYLSATVSIADWVVVSSLVLGMPPSAIWVPVIELSWSLAVETLLSWSWVVPMMLDFREPSALWAWDR